MMTMVMILSMVIRVFFKTFPTGTAPVQNSSAGNLLLAVGTDTGTRSHGSFEKVYAGEIICCGGAINSPQLLQLSGIGPAKLLKKYNQTFVVELR